MQSHFRRKTTVYRFSEQHDRPTNVDTGLLLLARHNLEVCPDDLDRQIGVLRAQPARPLVVLRPRGNGCCVDTTVDLPQQKVIFHAPQTREFSFEIEENVKEQLISGQDDIDLILQYEADIKQFEENARIKAYSAI